ncbi:MAG TPA: heavy metal translocating P-type ATPase metal-binding domain-containing protein [Polyangiales bacterium]
MQLAAHPSHVESLCLHCRSPIAEGVQGSFCCGGCHAVYDLLQNAGLSRYYDLRGSRALNPVGNLKAAHESPWREALAQELAAQGDARSFRIDVQGLQCGACVWLLEAVFRRQPGALQIHVNPALGQLQCSVSRAFSVEPFIDAVESFGYRVGPDRKRTSSESDGLLLRTGVAVAIAINVMLLSAAGYFGLESGPLFELMQTAGFVLASLSVALGGSYFIGRAYRGLRMGVLHLDLPIALGIVLAYAGSAIGFASRGAHESYLDTLSVFVAVMLLGRLVQERLLEKNRKALLEADGSSGLLARRIVEGRTALVTCNELRAGDALLVCHGEFVPVQGELEADSGVCSLEWVLGESEPRSFLRGATIPAGAVNTGKTPLRLRALRDFARSDLDVLLSAGGRTVTREAGDFWDTLARIYVWLVLLATAAGAFAWSFAGASNADVLEVATAILVVTCPCAFGIATPLAYELGVAGLRRLGLFVREGGFFERAARVRRVVFDKTGTLTTGMLELADGEPLATLSRAQLRVLYELTAQSAHPKSVAVARALLRLAPELQIGSGGLAEELSGQGLRCRIGGVEYRFGSAGFALPGSECAENSERTVFSADGEPILWLDYCEVARPDAKQELHQLAQDGYELWIASGDDAQKVAHMASELGIDGARALGGLTPAGKRDLLARIDEKDTLMLGDGINDGLALSAAFCSGTPAIDRPFVPSRADFYYLSAGLAPVRTALHVAQAVRRVVRNALGFAAAYNVLAVGLCVAGVMRPWLAAVMMPASSLAVIAYAVWSLSAGSSLWKS